MNTSRWTAHARPHTLCACDPPIECDTSAFALVSTGYHSCALRPDKTVECWDLEEGDTFHELPSASETFERIETRNGYTCGLKTSGELACWGTGRLGSDIPLEWTPPSGTFTSFTLSDEWACGIQAEGAVACWGQPGEDRLTPPAGRFSEVFLGDDNGCGIKTDDGALECWGKTVWIERDPPPTGAFVDVTMGGGSFMGCGIKAARQWQLRLRPHRGVWHRNQRHRDLLG